MPPLFRAVFADRTQLYGGGLDFTDRREYHWNVTAH
jgi:hypothetical protein